MSLTRLPLFEALASSKRVLLAGAGGGFDVYCGLPLMFALEARGKEVILANLTFSHLGHVEGERIAPAVVEVGAESSGSETYFPEKLLCRWFASRGRDVTVHCFEKVGVVPLSDAYRALAEALDVDAIVLVDGGTDSLMRGDEPGLGTPAEDMVSIAAARTLDVPTKLLVCLGFGVDTYHGVSHYHFLEAVAELTRAGAFLGAFSVLPTMPEARDYLDAVEFAHRLAPARPSIVNASVAAAIEGHYGDVHHTERTAGSTLWINPLMAQYFGFQLDPVADRVLYLDQLRHTRSMLEVVAIIEAFRRTIPIRPREPIPA